MLPLPEGDPAKAQPIASSVCAACHGADGNSPLPANPSLAGQHPEYLYKQLPDYKAGQRKNAVMSGMVAPCPRTTCAISPPISRIRSQARRGQRRELVTAGQKLYRGGDSETGVPACSGCHSPDGAGIPAQYPRLAGQHGEYTIAQLQSFRSGERANDRQCHDAHDRIPA